MKIGIDGRPLTEKRTGIGTYTYEIIKKLNELDLKNEYYIYSNKEVYLDFELNNNWKICKYSSKIGTFGLYFKLPVRLKKDNIDTFWGTQHCLPKRNKYTKSVNYILTIHDIALEKFKNIGSVYNTLIQKLILKKSCENANKIITVSMATKRDLIEILSIDSNKIDTVYCGINKRKEIQLSTEDRNKIEKKYKINEKTDFIFFLSTIEPRKNLDTAIKAFELYKTENDADLKFIISGGLGWKCKKILKTIENSKYKEDIIRTGYITKEEKEYFFKNCKAFVYPSLYEGFGIPILEAMQNGAIVITSNISSLPEVGGDVPLYLNNMYDEKELAMLLKQALSLRKDEKETIVKNGYEQIKKFSWVECATKILELFDYGEEKNENNQY